MPEGAQGGVGSPSFLGKGRVLRRLPGKDDIYSSSEEQVAGRDKEMQEGCSWADDTACVCVSEGLKFGKCKILL